MEEYQLYVITCHRLRQGCQERNNQNTIINWGVDGVGRCLNKGLREEGRWICDFQLNILIVFLKG